MQYQEGQILDGSDGQAYIVRNGVPTLMSAPAAAPSAVQVSGADPTLPVKRALEQAALAKAVRENQNAPLDARKAAADASKAEAEAALARSKVSKGDQGGPESAATRAAAIAGYNTASNLRRLIADIEAKDKAGPGATTGLSGLNDYLPYTENQRLDKAGDAVRGMVGQALGFTGGQLNTEREADAAVGPYLPHSSDRDAVRLDKIQRLKDLADLAESRAVQVLGGKPDRNGNVTPVTGAAGGGSGGGMPPPSGPTSGTMYYGDPTIGGGGGSMSVASGASRTEADPVRAGLNAKVNEMLKSGASDQAITGYLAQAGANAAPASVAAALAFRRKNPGYKGNYSVNLEDRAVPQSAARQAFQSLGAGPLGSYAVGAGDALTAGRLDNIAGAVGGNSAQVDAAKALLAKANPISSLLGNVTGGALATAGAEFGLARSGLQAATGLVGAAARAPMAADAAYGAAMGSDDPNHPLLGALGGAALGIAGGAVGQRLAGAVGGVRNEAVQVLRDRGIPLTFGQAVGGSGRVGAAIKGIEDRLSGVPVIGSFANARRLEGMQGFNRAAFDEALAPVQGNTAGVIGEAGVDAAQNVVGNAYDDALGGVQVRADLPFVQQMAGAFRNGRALPEPMAGRADYTLRTRVGNSFDGNRELTGNGYQQSLRGLRQDASAVRTEPYGYDFGNVADEAEGALTGLLDRQAPGVVPAVQRANQAFRNTEILRSAVNRARNGARVGETGTFAPSQLTDAAAQNAQRFGNSQGTTRQPFFDLTRQAQEVLPNAVPDSGTAGRLALTGILAGGGAGAGYLGDDAKTGAGVGAALAALQTQAAQRALVRLVLDRPEFLRRASDYAVRNGIGGALGAPLALQALPAR